MGQRKKHRVQPLGYVNFTKVIFRPIKRLKLIRNWCPGRSLNFIQRCQERPREKIFARVEVSLRSMEDRLVRARLTRVFAQQRSREKPLCYAGYVERLGTRLSRPYFCVFKYARAVKQQVWKSGTRLKTESETQGENAISDFFTDFEKKTRLFCSLGL